MWTLLWEKKKGYQIHYTNAHTVVVFIHEAYSSYLFWTRFTHAITIQDRHRFRTQILHNSKFHNLSIFRRSCRKTQNDRPIYYTVVGLLHEWGLVLKTKVAHQVEWVRRRWPRWAKVQVTNNIQVGGKAQVKKKQQYSWEKKKNQGKQEICDHYKWDGASLRCNQTPFGTSPGRETLHQATFLKN